MSGGVRVVAISAQSRKDVVLVTILAVYIIVMFSDGFLVYGLGFPFTLSNAILPFLLASLVHRRGGNVKVWVLVCILFVSAYLVAFALHSAHGMKHVTVIVVHLLIALMIVTTLRESSARAVLGIALPICFAVAIVVLIRGETYLGARLTFGVGYNPTFLAGMLAALILAAMVHFWEVRSWAFRAAVGVGILPLVVALLATQGRNAMLSLLLAVTVAALIYTVAVIRRHRVPIAFLYGAALVLAVAIGVVLNSSNIIYFMQAYGVSFDNLIRTVEYGFASADGTAGRTSIWGYYFEQLESGNFSMGLGAAGDSVTVSPPHNMYLRLAVETTPLGAGLYLLGLAMVALKTFAATRSIPLWAFALFLIVFAVGNDVLYYKYYWFSVILFAVCYAATRKRSRAFPVKGDLLQYYRADVVEMVR